MIEEYFKLAFKNLKKRGLRSWLTMLGIFIGIAAVVSLISLGNGLQNAVTGQFSTLSADKLTIQNKGTGFGPPGSTVVQKLTSRDVEIVKKVSGVDIVVPRLIRIVKVEYNRVANFNYIASLPSEKKAIDLVYEAGNIKIEEGRLIGHDETGVVLLGNDFRNKNLFGKEIQLNREIIIQNKSFKVVGFIKKSSSFQINSVILMPEKDLKKILNIDDEYDILVARVKDTKEINNVRENIEKALRKDRNQKIGEEDFSVQTPRQTIQVINTILTIINIVVSGIAAISLIVGGVGITNTMYTSVLERTKEIGIMKAIGAKNKDILFIFLFESSMLGLAGGVIGAAIGISTAFLISYGVNAVFPAISFGVSFSLPLLIFSIFFALIIGMISGIFPAIQASRLRPVEALRK